MAADKSSNGWFIQVEQFRLRKASDPHSSCIGTINSESNRGTSYRCMWRSDGTLGGGVVVAYLALVFPVQPSHKVVNICFRQTQCLQLYTDKIKNKVKHMIQILILLEPYSRRLSLGPLHLLEKEGRPKAGVRGRTTN